MVDVVRYSAVEDIGRVLNPMLAEGQIQGGVAQGIGQALGEEIVYDDPVSCSPGPSWTTRCRAPATCRTSHSHSTKSLTNVNPLGVKGVGEAGTVGASQPR